MPAPHQALCAVRELEHVEISLTDGCRLAARIWMPEDAEVVPRPAILEYIPYRKNDVTLRGDAVMHPYVAGHGYVCVRVDIRGSGESDGVLADEYLQQELDDGVEVISWLAAQPWCDGNVGIIGISWGGFNGLQLAAMRPPALKAVVTCCSSDDRYADDVHYMGGCLLLDNFSWAAQMFARNAFPPDPRHVGDRWRELWFERLRGSGYWLEPWLDHQHRDAYWRHGSVCEDLGQVRCPVYAVSGWTDGYCNTVFRLLSGLDVPRKGLVGPWAHTYPHVGEPGPAIGFLQECVRWWDHWLKDVDNGVMSEPMLRVWQQDSVRPEAAYANRSGQWITEPTWPSPHIECRSMALDGSGRLVAEGKSREPAVRSVSSPLMVGLFGGRWVPYSAPGDQPADQRREDADSLVFESEPLEEPLDILGEAIADLQIDCDRPVAMVAVRLNDVAPDGTATRVTYGLLNLTHRDSHEEPEPLIPAQTYRVRVSFKHIAQRFAAGHRIRFAISTSYWPIAWPAPEPAVLRIHTAASRLELPIRRSREEDGGVQPFPEPETSPAPDYTTIEPAGSGRWVHHDLGADTHVLEALDGEGILHFSESELTLISTGYERYFFRGMDYGSLCAKTRWVTGLERGDWSVRVVTETSLRCDEYQFHLTASMRAFEDETVCHEKAWQRSIPRRLV